MFGISFTPGRNDANIVQKESVAHVLMGMIKEAEMIQSFCPNEQVMSENLVTGLLIRHISIYGFNHEGFYPSPHTQHPPHLPRSSLGAIRAKTVPQEEDIKCQTCALNDPPLLHTKSFTLLR